MPHACLAAAVTTEHAEGPHSDTHWMQATVNLATETALVRAALPDEPDGHAERLEALGKELVQVSKSCIQHTKPVHV